MKKHFFTIIIFISIFFLINHFSSVYSMPSFKELEDIKNVAEVSNVEIKKWKVYIKDTKSNISLQRVKNELRDIFNKDVGYSWEKEEDEHHYQATGVIEKGNIIEKVIISVLPSKKGYTITYTYQLMVEGDIDSNVLNQTNILFDFEKNNRFLTVEGVTNGRTSNSLLSGKILDFMEGEKVEELNEKGFLSVSGYTGKWKNQLKLANQNLMNIQIGIRKLNEETSKVTIGTPIIISEY
ncbi:YwmB family TATA-box binding protein [Metabacillus herbersteinensis]|uniref:YwmB family TATA-box binding protein n=1 Tax=Metabacillus herbersteinensis TaxID=283816 RepID=A0ABV6GP23_9BACI